MCVLVIGHATRPRCRFVVRGSSWPYEPPVPREFPRAVVDKEGPFADAADYDGLDGPSLAPMVLDPHLGSRMKLFGFGPMYSLRDSQLLTPPQVQMLLEHFTGDTCVRLGLDQGLRGFVRLEQTALRAF